MSVNNLDEVVKFLEEASAKLFKCFSNNLIKNNVGRCHLLVSTNNTVNIGAQNFDIKTGCSEKLLGVKFGRKLTFNSHISNLCKKASKKVHALAIVTPYTNISKRRVVMNASLNHNSVTAVLYGCVTIMLTIVK